MSFKEIIGHRRPIRFLQKAIVNDRLPNAYLFLGPEGVGKRLTALTLAKTLNCEQGSDDCCDECLSCRKIEESNHPDVSVISPDGQFIKIETIRQLQRSLSYRPYEGRKRVCVIDGADYMKAEAANALLKTLEEPPGSTLLVLLSGEREVLLPTIVSRCQSVAFGSLPMDEVVSLLCRRVSMDEREAAAVAMLSQGSLGRALEMVEQKAWQKRPGLIRDVMDLPSQSTQKVFAMAESLIEFGDDLSLAFLMMLSWYRDLIIWKEHHDVDRLINRDFEEEIRDKALLVSRRSLLRRVEAINETSRAMIRNPNRLLAVESLLLQLR